MTGIIITIWQGVWILVIKHSSWQSVSTCWCKNFAQWQRSAFSYSLKANQSPSPLPPPSSSNLWFCISFYSQRDFSLWVETHQVWGCLGHCSIHGIGISRRALFFAFASLLGKAPVSSDWELIVCSSSTRKCQQLIYMCKTILWFCKCRFWCKFHLWKQGCAFQNVSYNYKSEDLMIWNSSSRIYP